MEGAEGGDTGGGELGEDSEDDDDDYVAPGRCASVIMKPKKDT